MPTLTDDVRILVALREGLDVRDAYKRGYGWSNPPEYLRCIQDPTDKERWRWISSSAIDRAHRAGLIEVTSDQRRHGEPGYDGYDGHDHRYRLTEGGQAAAAALDVDIEAIIRRPALINDEDRERNRVRAGARKALKILVDEAKHLRCCWYHGGISHWNIEPTKGWGRNSVKAEVVVALAPYLEIREDGNRLRRWDAGKPKDLQPNRAGIDAITEGKALVLACSPAAPAEIEKCA